MLEAKREYLTPLEYHEVEALAVGRCGVGCMSQEEIASLYEQAGGHPWLTQRLVSLWLAVKEETLRPTISELATGLEDDNVELFEDWWGENGYAGGLSDIERDVYRVIRKHSQISALDASTKTNHSEHASRKALRILQGLGAVLEAKRGLYRTGALIFAHWVSSTGVTIPMGKIKVLFLSANPVRSAKLRIDDEIREIKNKLRESDYRDAFDFIPCLAARPDDLIRGLHEHEPQIVHFSGHGSRAQSILFVDDQGKRKPVTKAALVQVFQALRGNIRLVLLNACSTRPQAEAVAGTIDCTIGMREPIGDAAAIVFSASFYRARVRLLDQTGLRGGQSLALAGGHPRGQDARAADPSGRRCLGNGVRPAAGCRCGQTRAE